MTRPQARTVDPDPAPDVVTFEPEPMLRAELLKERISTWLSALALLAMSVGVGWGLWPAIGPFALLVGGGLLALFVMLADAGRRPKPVTVAAEEKKPVPGPSHPGNLHAKGPRSLT